MEGFTYTNIFDTKGIEYLIIIAFLLLLIPFSVILNKRVKFGRKIRDAFGTLTASILRVPQGLFFSSNHAWTYLERTGTARVGLDDLLMHITGEVNVKYVKKPGEDIRKGEIMAEVEHEDKTLRIFSPISGKVIEANYEVSDNPDMLIEDPYWKGWMYQIRPSDWKAETKDYCLAGEANSWLKQELNRYKDFLAVNMKKYAPETSMVVMQDGGEIRESSLSEMPRETWKDFQAEFLNP